MGPERMEFEILVEWLDQLSFNVRWDLPDAPDLFMDEPPALGGSGEGPNASRMVVAGVANCLGASLLFCLQKSRLHVKGYKVRAGGELARNERGRLRLVGIRIEPLVRLPEDERDRMERCLKIFDDYCIVTESIRHGIPVDVQVFTVDAEGREEPVLLDSPR